VLPYDKRGEVKRVPERIENKLKMAADESLLFINNSSQSILGSKFCDDLSNYAHPSELL